MKSIYAILACLIFMFSTSSVLKTSCYNPGNTAARFQGLKGKVKSTIEYFGKPVSYEEATKNWSIVKGEMHTGTFKTFYAENGKEKEIFVLNGTQLLFHNVDLYNQDCYLGIEQRDSLDKVIEKTMLIQSSATNTFLEFQVYDGAGNKTKYVICREDTIARVRTVEVKGEAGQLEFSQRRELNKEGLVTSEMICYNDASNCFTLSYEYIKFDKKGNWIERLERNSNMDGVTLRE